MAIGITGKFKPKGDFPLMDAEDIEMPDGTRLYEYKFESDVTEGVLLEEQDVDWFSLDSTYGYAAAFDPSPFTMAVGETYRIMWDEQEFNVTAQDASALMEGAIFAGNGNLDNPSAALSGMMTQKEWLKRKNAGSTLKAVKNYATYGAYIKAYAQAAIS